MIELLTKKRMFCLALLLLLCILFILFYEEYEDLWFVKSSNFRQSTRKPKPQNVHDADSLRPEDTNSQECEQMTLSQPCQACSDFEIQALQTEFCLKTRFYEVYDCHDTNVTRSVYLPCPSPVEERSRKFTVFTAFVWLLAVLSFAFVKWRKQELQRRAYARLPVF